jgi:cell division septation protein DedD
MTERIPTTSGEHARGVLLSDKHIVFAVMTATAVAVIVFLCGVFVGRGVLSAQPAVDGSVQDGRKVAADSPGSSTDVDTDAADPQGETNTGAPPLPPQGTAYPDRLFGAGSADEKLKPQEQTLTLPEPPPDAPGESPTPAAPVSAAVAPNAAASGAAAPPPARVKEDPGKGAYTVQVGSFRQKQQAEASRVVENLKRHRFPAYLFEPVPGGNEGFRVRVGKYKSRQEADVMAATLQKEKYQTWITRLPY